MWPGENKTINLSTQFHLPETISIKMYFPYSQDRRKIRSFPVNRSQTRKQIYPLLSIRTDVSKIFPPAFPFSFSICRPVTSSIYSHFLWNSTSSSMLKIFFYMLFNKNFNRAIQFLFFYYSENLPNKHWWNFRRTPAFLLKLLPFN